MNVVVVVSCRGLETENAVETGGLGHGFRDGVEVDGVHPPGFGPGDGFLHEKTAQAVAAVCRIDPEPLNLAGGLVEREHAQARQPAG